MTLQTFVAWKKRKLREKAEAEKAAMDEKKKNMKSGLTIGMSGRDMFTFDPKMVSNGVSKCLDFRAVHLNYFSVTSSHSSNPSF